MPSRRLRPRLRTLPIVACSVVLAVVGTSGVADADGGTQRWSTSYDAGDPAFTNDVVVSPDGSRVYVTGTTEFGRKGRMATVAYDAASGARAWADEYPGKNEPGWGGGTVLTVSPDGKTVFVGGGVQDGFVIAAYDASAGKRKWLSHFAEMGAGPTELATNPDGSRLFVYATTALGWESAIIAYAPDTGDQLWDVRHVSGHGSPGAMTVSADGSAVFVADTLPPDNVNCLFTNGGYRTAAYDATDGSPVWSATFKVADEYACGTATDLRLSPDGTKVFVTGYGSGDRDGLHESGTVAYDASNGTELWAQRDDRIHTLSGDTYVTLGMDPDGSKVVVFGSHCSDDTDNQCTFSTGSTLAYDSATGARLWESSYDAGGQVYANDLVVNPDGSDVYVTGQETLPCYAPCNDGAQTNAPVVAYDLDTGTESWATVYPDNYGQALAVSPDGGGLYLAGSLTGSATASKLTLGRRGGSAATACSGRCGFSTSRVNTGAGPGTLQESDPSLRLDGWRGFFDENAIGGAYRASKVRGDIAVFRTPPTTKVALLTQQGPNRGKARVLIDGRSKGTINLFSTTPTARAVSFKGLAKKAHTITVKVLGRKSGRSTGTWVAVDGFTFRAADGVAQENAPGVHFNAWTSNTASAANGGSYRISSSPSARVSARFTGRSVKWVTAMGPTYGRARVVIDGKARIVDLYRRHQDWRAALKFTGLSKGRHRISVIPLGTRNRASTGTGVIVDAFVVRR